MRATIILAMGLCTVLLGGCGGSDKASQATVQMPMMVRQAAQELQLPLLQSGSQHYANVRLKLSPDGTFQVTSYQTVNDPQRAADAELDPPLPLDRLHTSTEPVYLRIRRHHDTLWVYHGTVLRLQQGHWVYSIPPQSASTLMSADFRHNPALQATEHHHVVLPTASGEEDEFPLRLENKSYRFCVQSHDGGGDRLTLRDAAGRVVVRLEAGQSCTTYRASAGTYRLRHAHASTQSGRVAFFGPRMTTLQKRSNETMPVVLTSSSPEYLALRVADTDPVTQLPRYGFLTTKGFLSQRCGFQATSANMVPDLPSEAPISIDYPLPNNAGWVTWGQLADTSDLQAEVLFDGRNFFQGLGNQLGGPLGGGCAGLPMAGRFEWGISYVKPLAPTIEVQPGGNSVVLRVPSGYSPFYLQSENVWQPGDPIGFPSSYDGRWTGYGTGGVPIDDSGWMRPLQPSELPARMPQIQIALRYWPNGVEGNWVPGQGRVALFSSSDCTGPVMLVDRYDLPGILPGPLGSFNGSLLLGEQTVVNVFSGLNQTGTQQRLSAPGCISAGVIGFLPQSLSTEQDTVEMGLQGGGCVQCNLEFTDLSSMNLAGARFLSTNLLRVNLQNANLAGADLRNAVLQSSNLDRVNLDGAQLCGAQLNQGQPIGQSQANVTYGPTSATGAFLRNTVLDGANLSGVDFSGSSFFSKPAGLGTGCPIAKCDGTTPPTCASAANRANIDGAKFDSSFISGVDFRSANGAATFDMAVVVGSAFNGTLDNSSFIDAILFGTDFGQSSLANVKITGANLTAPEPGATCWQFQLPPPLSSFPGFTKAQSPGSSTCSASGPASICVSTVIAPTTPALAPNQPLPLAQTTFANGGCGDQFSTFGMCGGQGSSAANPFGLSFADSCWNGDTNSLFASRR